MLGAIQGKLAELQEQARSFKMLEEMRHNISANLANARDFIGLSQPSTPAAAAATDAMSDLGASSGGSVAAAAGVPLSRCALGASLCQGCRIYGCWVVLWDLSAYIPGFSGCPAPSHNSRAFQSFMSETYIRC